MTSLHKVLVGLTTLAVVLSGIAYFRKPTTIVNNPPLGSVTSNVLTNQAWIVNGLREEFRATKFGTSTSTPCSFVSPSSTSTLTFASLEINVGSSTATTWTLSKAVKPNATTTLLDNFGSLASGAQATFVATTTPNVGNPTADTALQFAPNTYLTWGVQGLTFTGYDSSKLAGYCTAKFYVNAGE